MGRYARKATDGRDVVECKDCGWTLALRGMALHRKGVYHRHSKRIRALLEKECLTFREISERINVNRERVRQIAVLLGFTSGTQRRTACAIERRTVEVKAIMRRHPLLVSVTAAAGFRGLTVAPVEHANIGVAQPISRRQVMVNGVRCALRRSSPVQGRIGLKGMVVGPEIGFVLHLLPDKKRWLVVPAHKQPSKATMFTEGAQPHGRHWQQYIEAWHLLGAENGLSE